MPCAAKPPATLARRLGEARVLDPLRIPWRFQRGARGRMLLTIVALASGVALVCAIDLVNRAVLRAFSEVVDSMAGRAALQVTAGGDGLFPETAAADVAKVAGVELVVPVVSAVAFVADDSGELLTVHGVDVTNEDAVRVYESGGNGAMADPLEFLNQADSILLTRAFASRRGLDVGAAIALDTPHGRRRFVVRGLLAPTGVARVYGGNLAVMDLFAAEASFTGPSLVNRLDVVLRRDAEREAVRRAIEVSLPPGLRVELPAQRKADLQAAMQSLHVMLDGVAVVALVAAFLIAFNRLSCVYEARTWQMGILRAAGMGSRHVWWEMIKESALLGAAGIALGVPLGLALARVLLPAIAATTALNYKLVAPEAELHLSPVSIGLAAALGMTAALLAATLPAARAAGVSVLEALRGRGVEVRDTRPLVLAAARAATALLLAVALGLQAATHAVVWGLLATVLLVIATGMAARPLLERFTGSRLVQVLHALGPTGRFAAAFARLNPRRTARTAAMLGVGLGAVVWLGMIAHSFESSLADAIGHGIRPDLVVSSAHIASGYLEAPLDETLGEALRNVDGVAAVAGVRLRDWPYAGGDIALDALDPEYFVDGRMGRWPLHAARAGDVWGDVARGTAVVVSSNLVLNLGIGVGDVLHLDTPNGPLDLEIAGVTTDFASPRGSVKINRALYCRMWNDAQVNRFFVRAEDPAALGVLRRRIARELGAEHALRILSSSELLDYFREQVHRAFAPLDILATMVLVVVLVGMSDTPAAGVLERTHDIGVMRALGAQRFHLRRLEMAEALLPGILGLALAIGSGLALGTLWVRGTFPYLLGWVLETQVPWARLGLVAAATLAVCVAGSILPGLQAARLDPGEAIRSE